MRRAELLDRDGQTMILVVEDNPVERLLLDRVLREAGFERLLAPDGETALAHVAQRAPDLILLDALLPDIDGFEICERLRADPRLLHIPVMMLTGLDDVASIDRAYQCGATDFFTKPINTSLLVHRIRYLLRARDLNTELRLSRQSLASAQQIARLGHWDLEIDRGRLRISEELCRLCELEPDYDDDTHPLLVHCHPEDAGWVAETIERAARLGEDARFEHRVTLPEAGERVMEVHLSTRTDEDDTRHLLGICMDVTARKETEGEILRLAYFDRLTGLPNRSLLELYLDRAIPRAHLRGGSIGLLVIDLDLFSRVNNSMGHSAGDAVLRQVGNRLTRLVSPPASAQMLAQLALAQDIGQDEGRDLVARLGADTFVVLLGRGGDELALANMASRAMALMQQPFLYRGQELFMTASIGIVCSDSGAMATETLLQQADLALHEAKAEGRSVVREFHGGLVARVAAQMSIQSDLRRALHLGEFRLHYQPRLGLADGRVTGFEALLRWQHGSRGLVPPGEFIGIAEETGQIVEIGRWALQHACWQHKQWVDAGLTDGRMAVNVSARQFREPGLVAMVDGVLAQTGLDPHYLELEITEGVVMSEPRADELIQTLRERGITVALDDFGTGFSSLSYLIRFPFDTLKIDRCFVQHIASDPQKQAIVEAVIGFSHPLHLEVVAEGVETEEELAAVTALGCNEVQGYLVCKPLPAPELEAWLQQRSAPGAIGRAADSGGKA